MFYVGSDPGPWPSDLVALNPVSVHITYLRSSGKMVRPEPDRLHSQNLAVEGWHKGATRQESASVAAATSASDRPSFELESEFEASYNL
jgi:hypothetical protein